MKTVLFRTVILFVASYAVLMVPLPDPAVPDDGPQRPAGFRWDADTLWYDLEERFVRARQRGCAGERAEIVSELSALDAFIGRLSGTPLRHDDSLFRKAEALLFTVASRVAGCPEFVGPLIDRASLLRDRVKEQAAGWDLNDPEVRATMYRLLYGSRAALEEVMLQVPDTTNPSIVHGTPEPSSTPACTILGVTIHSGDILVSRGGAPTSALIARGNDFPGNFSHVALVHVADDGASPTIIESHIERGVTRSTLEEYLRDTKLRVMVLRMRADHPSIVREPLLPHHAATLALKDAENRHIPYDFAMDFTDPSSLFCSEVASAAYGYTGVRLWMGMSTISSPGLRAWLAAFGVRHFTTQEPSDLEYDPQLRVVAEWRDPETLYKDHIDNAATEVMLEGAEEGDRLTADPFLLPMARTMKAYSWVLNLFGGVGPVPEGMDAAAALKHRQYTQRHEAITARLNERAEEFRVSKGYRPPYWRLLELARDRGPS